MKITNRSARRYLCAVRSLLPAGCAKCQIMAQIKDRVLDYLAQQPGAGEEELWERLGAPQDIAAACLESMGTAEILQRLRTRRRIMTAVYAIALAGLVICAAITTQAIIDVNNSAEGTIYITVE